MGTLNARLGESDDLRAKLEEARELFQNMECELAVADHEARDSKRSWGEARGEKDGIIGHEEIRWLRSGSDKTMR